MAAVALTVALGLPWVASVGSSLMAANAAPASTSCSFANAGTGTYARTLCWFDLSAYNVSLATSPAGQPMAVSLPGGYKITFTLNVSGGPVKPVTLPTYGGAYLGNNGHYSGVAGKPALYQTTPGTTTKAALTDINVVDANGNQVQGYSFVGADAESTDANESITWTSDQPLNLISTLGNACNSGALFTGAETTTVKCAATQSNTKTGTAILAARHPAFFTQTMVGSGLQAVAFGVLVSTVQLTKTVVGRVDPSDAFNVSVTNSDGFRVASADTGTGNTATTGQVTVLTSDAGESYTLAESATSGLLSNYSPSWSCTRNGGPDSSLPSGPAGTSASVVLGIGDFVNCTITNTAESATLSLEKHAGTPVDVNQDGVVDAGDTVAYTFTVTNTGDLTLHNVGASDRKIGAVTCPQPTLASGESETCTADSTYTITAADVAAGAVNNTATASASPPGSNATVSSPPSSISVPTEAPAPAVSLNKVAEASGGDTNAVALGETITYTYLVTNTGNDYLTSVTVDDPSDNPVSCPSLTAPGLAPGEQVACTATHTVTAADVSAGHVTDTATAAGTDSNGITSAPSAPSTATVGVEPAAPAVSLAKSGTVSPSTDQGAVKVGDTIAYSYTVTNTGNVNLVSLAVHDPTAGTVTCPMPAAPGLPPGQSETCTANVAHTVTQADVDAGKVVDTATASGTDGSGTTSPPSDLATVTVDAEPAAPAVSVAKTGTVSPAADQSAAKVGDTITYSYTVTNTGNVDLASVAVDDPTNDPVACPSLTAPGLAPGASLTCTVDHSYTVTQTDVDTGSVTDTAIATGTDIHGVLGPPSGPATNTIHTVPPDPSVSIAKQATLSPIDDETAKVGDTITYTYEVTNTGDVDLASVAVSDPSLGPVTCPGVPAPGLPPGEIETCTADRAYTVTQADVDAGKVIDTATATGTDDNGLTSSPSDPSTITELTAVAKPAVSILKMATVSPAADQNAAKIGDTITYTYLVTNTGNVDLASVAVTDPTLGRVSCPVPPPPGLPPEASETCTADTVHTVTQADVNAGEVVDTATAISTDNNGLTGDPSRPSTAVVHTAAVVVSVSAVTSTPSGLGSINTDLGRWTPDSGPPWGLAAAAGGTAAIAAGIFAVRRRRRHRTGRLKVRHRHVR